MDKLERVACYIRVSTQEQKLHGISLDAQREKLREYADIHNLIIAGWYEDEGISGRKLIKNRPALQRMLNDAKLGKFDRIIFIKLDRFFRSVAEYHECMKLIDPVVWTATEEKYDLTTANGRAFVNMKLTIAELEADQTSERIKLVNEYKVKTGQAVTGSVPWSHKIVKTDNGKRIVVNPDNRDNCIKVIDYFLQTKSLSKTLIFCEPYHSFYDLVGLKRWLTNTMLIGKFKDNSNYCEPLISIEKFTDIQSALPRSIKKPRTYTPLFQKIIICPKCGRHMVSTTCKQKYKNTVYRYIKYRCCDRFRCDSKLTLSENCIERCLLENIDSVINDYNISNIDVTSSNYRDVDTSKIKDEITRINYMFERGRISITEYDKKYSILQSELIKIENNINTVDQERIDYIKSLLTSDWRNLYDSLDLEHKRDFWHNIIRDVEFSKQGSNYKIERIFFW